MMSNRPVQEFSDDESSLNERLNDMFAAYRSACPEPEPGVNFMPSLWAKIEAREHSTNLFGRMAKALVTVALAATVIMGMLVSTASQPNSGNTVGTYLEAVAADHVSALEPLNLDRISEMEQQ